MNICIYGAAMEDIRPVYKEKTEEFGELCALHGHRIVFGGGARGLMGAAARGAKRKGGYLIGISPSFFQVDGALYEECDEFIYPDTMRERKMLLEDKSDAFVIMPGGIGTFDEFFETLVLKSLNQMGTKPIVLYNIDHYYDSMKAMLEHSVAEGFVAKEVSSLYRILDTPEEVMDYLESAL